MYFVSLWERAGGARRPPKPNHSPKEFHFHPQKKLTGSFYFCRRKAAGSYVEHGFANVMSFLQDQPNADSKVCVQVLFYIHGFGAEPEGEHGVFHRAARMQKMLDEFTESKEKAAVKIILIPVIWPCGRKVPMRDLKQFKRKYSKLLPIAKRYHIDRWTCLEASRAASRIFEAFDIWKDELPPNETQCSIRMNIICHSMGNRLFRDAMEWYRKRNPDQQRRIFSNVFMTAPEISNNALERDQPGGTISRLADNVIVYYAYDDKAVMGVSLEGVLVGKIAKPLGEHGPRSMREDVLDSNIFTVDCNEVNQLYDKEFGHTYFMDQINTEEMKPGKVFEHIAQKLVTSPSDMPPRKRRMFLSP